MARISVLEIVALCEESLDCDCSFHLYCEDCKRKDDEAINNLYGEGKGDEGEGAAQPSSSNSRGNDRKILSSRKKMKMKTPTQVDTFGFKRIGTETSEVELLKERMAKLLRREDISGSEARPLVISLTKEGYGCCFDGILYYQARVDDHDIIMRFDVKSESFSPINYPKYSSFRRLYKMMIPYEGRLALVTRDFPGELYILKDADGHEWTRQCLPRVFKSKWRIYMQLKGITDAGELVFAPRSFVDSFYILYFDPRRNSTREAFFEGFMGDEFRRSDYQFPNDRTDCLGVFANHMESLASF
ncbi:unnamed protein product [Brassica oleracea var. botrytis]|uniref:F-box associated beta-propeller type 3 domain-containing protein n=1 Tax=Brassica oleracea var. oleracea TaxID=109376 RepID=A0A0D3BIL2_BRAOL